MKGNWLSYYLFSRNVIPQTLTVHSLDLVIELELAWMCTEKMHREDCMDSEVLLSRFDSIDSINLLFLGNRTFLLQY